LAKTVVEFLQQNPEQKFTAREIANWIFQTYPDKCRQKQKRSTATVNPLDNETALLQQIVAEIGSQRPHLQKRHPEVKTTEGRPRKYYFTESTDSAKIDHAESHEVSPASNINGSIVKEHMIFIRYFLSFSAQSLSFTAKELTKNVRIILVAQAATNGFTLILSVWKTLAVNGTVK
jgi:hypothetical protein